MQTLSKINPICRVRSIRERLFSLSCMFSSTVITTRHDYVCDLRGHQTTQVLTVFDSVTHRTGSNGERGQINDLDIFQMQLIGPFASQVGSEMGARRDHQIDQRKQLGSIFPTHDRSRTIGIEILGQPISARTMHVFGTEKASGPNLVSPYSLYSMSAISIQPVDRSSDKGHVDRPSDDMDDDND